MHYYFRVLCFDYKLISVEYFFDKMSYYELSDLIQNVQYIDRNQWEQNRLVCLSIAQKLCKKQLKLTDIYKLPWDNEHNYKLTDEQIQINNQLQNQICDFLNNNENKETK